MAIIVLSHILAHILESTFSKAGRPPSILGDFQPFVFGLTASEVNGTCHLKAGVDGALRGVKDDVSGAAGFFLEDKNSLRMEVWRWVVPYF